MTTKKEIEKEYSRSIRYQDISSDEKFWIVQNYQNAKNQIKQVEILSDLFDTKKSVIRRILREFGIRPPGKDAAKKKMRPQYDKNEVIRLSKEGLTQTEIGKRVGISEATVSAVVRKARAEEEKTMSAGKKAVKVNPDPEFDEKNFVPEQDAPVKDQNLEKILSEKAEFAARLKDAEKQNAALEKENEKLKKENHRLELLNVILLDKVEADEFA